MTYLLTVRQYLIWRDCYYTTRVYGMLFLLWVNRTAGPTRNVHSFVHAHGRMLTLLTNFEIKSNATRTITDSGKTCKTTNALFNCVYRCLRSKTEVRRTNQGENNTVFSRPDLWRKYSTRNFQFQYVSKRRTRYQNFALSTNNRDTAAARGRVFRIPTLSA